MIETPAIPEWIREFKHPGYTNVFSFLPKCERLYGTETLFGDWGAEVLFLAKDAAPTHVIKSLAEKEAEKGKDVCGAWRHAQRGDAGGFRTNEQLVILANEIQCSKLYGSATANMLCDDPRWSRALPDFKNGPLHDYLIEVLRWVVDKKQMPNLRVIACLGADAWHLTCNALDLTCNALDREKESIKSRKYRDEDKYIVGKVGDREIAATSHYHPAARVSKEEKKRSWDNLETVRQKMVLTPRDFVVL